MTPERPGVWRRLFGWIVCPLPPPQADLTSRDEYAQVRERLERLEAEARVKARRR